MTIYKMSDIEVFHLNAGPALDWAVGEVLGKHLRLTNRFCSREDGSSHVEISCCDEKQGRPWEPSESWAQGGILIEKFKICLRFNDFSGRPHWAAESLKGISQHKSVGATALEAVCRYSVAEAIGVHLKIPSSLAEALYARPTKS